MTKKRKKGKVLKGKVGKEGKKIGRKKGLKGMVRDFPDQCQTASYEPEIPTVELHRSCLRCPRVRSEYKIVGLRSFGP